jgi:hypothetical protein
VVEALRGEGLVSREGAIYRAELSALLDAVLSETTWSELGVEEAFGRFSITSTDPLRSNSGNMYAGLVANVLSQGVAGSDDLDRVLPDLIEVFRVQGAMEHSTGTLFERFLDLGVGRFPIIVGYESQYIEFARENPDTWPSLRDRLILIYPTPTVWSSHPLIALNENGTRLMRALGDEELEQIAWEQHGFRGGSVTAQNDPRALGLDSVAREVTRVMQMPRPAVVFDMMAELEQLQ